MPDRSILEGLYGSKFYEMIHGALNYMGIPNIAAFLAQYPNYWYDEEKWKSVYDLAGTPNPTRQFVQDVDGQSIPVMAVYIGEDGETPLLTNEGTKRQSGDIPRMGMGLAFSAKAYEDLLAVRADYTASQFSEKVFMQFCKDWRDLIQSVHSQRSFTGLQIESKGSYVSTKENNQGGLSNVKINTFIPASNKKRCGGYNTTGQAEGKKYAWSSDNADPIGDLIDMFVYSDKNHLLPSDPKRAVYRIGVTAYSALKNHVTTKNRIAMWKTNSLIPAENIGSFRVTDKDLADYFADNSLPAIEKEDYFGFTNYLDTDSMTIKKHDMAAFDANTVLLRYNGKFGEFQWAKVSNIFGTAMSPVFYTEGNAIAIQREEGSKGERFSAFSLCAPVPYRAQSCLYLDTTQAAS